MLNSIKKNHYKIIIQGVFIIVALQIRILRKFLQNFPFFKICFNRLERFRKIIKRKIKMSSYFSSTKINFIFLRP